MDNFINIGLKGAVNAEGKISGKGDITVNISDATKSMFAIDYKSADEVVLKLLASTDIRISTDNSLTLTGGISKNIFNSDITGNLSAEFIISKQVAAVIEHSFAKTNETTSLTIKLKL